MSHGIGRQLSHEVLEQYRFRAIELRNKKWKVGDIAEAFGVNRRAVSRWFTVYSNLGKGGLKSKKAPGPSTKLSEKEISSILKSLENPATDFGFETPLWTCKRLQLVIKRKTHKDLHISNVWRMLIKLGFSNQSPEKRALQADPKEGDRWLKEEWSKIQQYAKRWRAIIYFVDEAGVSLIPVMGKTWAPKGETPIVKVTGNKGGFCVTSAISPSGRMLFRIEKETVDSEVHIQFLRQILTHHPRRKVIVVEDQAPPHTAKQTRQFVDENKERFALYYLPPYSPHLNPDEEVWNNLKNQKLRAHQALTKKEFKPLILAKMKSIQMKPNIVRSFFL